MLFIKSSLSVFSKSLIVVAASVFRNCCFMLSIGACNGQGLAALHSCRRSEHRLKVFNPSVISNKRSRTKPAVSLFTVKPPVFPFDELSTPAFHQFFQDLAYKMSWHSQLHCYFLCLHIFFRILHQHNVKHSPYRISKGL
jgi:hypothetical protein